MGSNIILQSAYLSAVQVHVYRIVLLGLENRQYYEQHLYFQSHRWIEACIEDELPTTTELEEALRNGVILGRLGHFYAPEILPLRRIYDRDQAKYHVCSKPCVYMQLFVFL